MQLEAAAESRICVVTSQHRIQLTSIRHNVSKYAFCPDLSVHIRVQSPTAGLLSETKWVPYIHFSYCLQEQVICRKNCLELGFEEKFFEKTNQNFNETNIFNWTQWEHVTTTAVRSLFCYMAIRNKLCPKLSESCQVFKDIDLRPSEDGGKIIFSAQNILISPSRKK